jgi:hypothetical protein
MSLGCRNESDNKEKNFGVGPTELDGRWLYLSYGDLRGNDSGTHDPEAGGRDVSPISTEGALQRNENTFRLSNSLLRVRRQRD